MDHVVDPLRGIVGPRQVREPQRRMIVVELERDDPRGVGLEGEHEDVAHQPHVLGDVLRDAVRRPRHVGLVERWLPALQFPSLSGGGDPLLHVADAVEIFVELPPVARADPPPQVARLLDHGVEHALVPLLRPFLEEPVEGERGIEFQGRGRGRRTPRDVGAVEHRVVLVHRRIRLLAAEHEARHLRPAAIGLGEQLVDARARADVAAGGQRGAREQVARLRAVDVALAGLLVVEPLHEEQLLAEAADRLEHLAELHVGARALGPPLLRMEAVAAEQHRQPHGRLVPAHGRLRLIAPDGERLHPRQRHRHAQAAEHGPPRNDWIDHRYFSL